MDHHLKDFYRQFSDEAPRGNFHSVIALHLSPDIPWNTIKAKVPDLCKGWYELAHLDTKDRIEFSRDFWLAKLPYRQGLNESINRFFSSLDDIGIFLTQKKFEDPYEASLVYSIKDNGGFFRGAPPASEKQLVDLQKFFSDFILPIDYLAFLQIHNGYCKATDCTGITPSEDMPAAYEALQESMMKREMLTSKNSMVDPKTLIPFYESFGMPFYQCFWSDWYPEEEMGNVYYSGIDHTISDVFSGKSSMEIMAFPTFTDWLMFYLERFE
jgi:SMI1 / KNR4 family (SUKH-1)